MKYIHTKKTTAAIVSKQNVWGQKSVGVKPEKKVKIMRFKKQTWKIILSFD